MAARHPRASGDRVRGSPHRALVAEKLRSWGIETHEGLAKTGVVGTLRCGNGARAIGLRADIDALPMEELNDVAASVDRPGQVPRMRSRRPHRDAAGSGALSRRDAQFRRDGAFHLPACRGERRRCGRDGARGIVRKVSDGRRLRHAQSAQSCRRANSPCGAGPALACADNFGIVLRGRGTHAAWPHLGIDLVVVASQIVLALQTIVSRQTSPLEFRRGQRHNDAWRLERTTSSLTKFVCAGPRARSCRRRRT